MLVEEVLDKVEVPHKVVVLVMAVLVVAVLVVVAVKQVWLELQTLVVEEELEQTQLRLDLLVLTAEKQEDQVS